MASSSVSDALSLLKVFDQLGLQEIKKIFLLDVGASGGIEPHWFGLGDKLAAIGFDPPSVRGEAPKRNKYQP